MNWSGMVHFHAFWTDTKFEAQMSHLYGLLPLLSRGTRVIKLFNLLRKRSFTNLTFLILYALMSCSYFLIANYHFKLNIWCFFINKMCVFAKFIYKLIPHMIFNNIFLWFFLVPTATATAFGQRPKVFNLRLRLRLRPKKAGTVHPSSRGMFPVDCFLMKVLNKLYVSWIYY